MASFGDFLGFLFLFVAVLSGVAVAEKGDEGAVLLSLKLGFGDPVGHLSDWNEENLAAYCSWTGVECDSVGQVIGLDLSAMNVTGNLSESVQFLSELQTLNLASNFFSGQLPNSIANLTKLTELNLSRNSFEGWFPQGLSRAKNLRILTTYSNNFTGPLPGDLGLLSEVQHLDFRGSYFEGKIPSTYGRLSNLTFLGLSGNNLGGAIPLELGNLSRLNTLILAYNRFEGGIPAELGNLTRLEYLDLASAGLTGSIPPELCKLTRLSTLFLYKNRLTGNIPKDIGKIVNLQSLDMSDNMLSGSIPESIGGLKELRLLSLMFNNLSGTVPHSLGLLPKLVTLEIWNNSLSGSLPRHLGRSSALEWLDASSNMFTGAIPSGLCRGGRLTRLILFNNRFSGQIPESLAQCRTLWRVRIHNNQLSGPIPHGFGLLPNLTRFELNNNNLSGSIPSDLSESPKVSFIDLSQNSFGGPLPTSIFKISSLQTFAASRNRLQGRIPSDFGSCPNLSILDLSFNSISGSIPEGLVKCERLVDLDLSHNRLSANIPQELGRMPVLSMLDLSHNNLTGTIPATFGNATALELLNVSCNNLSGPLPSQGIFRSANADSFAGNPRLCGGTITTFCLQNKESVPRVSKRGPPPLTWLLGVIFSVGLAMLLLGGRFLHKNIKERLHRCDANEDNIKEEWPWRLTAFQKLNFTSSDILASLTDSNIVGIGATGTVYRAQMPGGETVAIKRLWKCTPENAERSLKCEPCFATEANILGRLRHRNIVKLLGYCYSNSSPILVYEYMPNGSLADALHGKTSATNLLGDWVTRYNIALGIAQGLCYLHHDCTPAIVHRDVKSNNILLDSKLEARVADFGVAKLMEENEPMSIVAGSYGYIAPEYAYTLKVDEKSDIYSFGVVLMELVTGKRAVDPEFGEEMNIVDWVRSRKGIWQALDAEVAESSSTVKDEMTMVLRIALLCTSRSPKERPSMRDVVSMLRVAEPRRKKLLVVASNSPYPESTVHVDVTL